MAQVGYARVSSVGQSLAVQLDKLRHCDKVFQETVSGAAGTRPRLEACLEYVPETQIGEYVLVHVGFAISRIDEAEAERTYQALRDLDQLTELESPVVEEMEPGGYRQ